MGDPIVIGIVSFTVLLVLMLVSVPIAISLAIVAVVGYFVFAGRGIGLLALVPFDTLNSFVLTAIPLYIFMGEVLVHCGVSEMLYRGTSKMLAWAPGGLLHSNVGACALFACISGSSPATAAAVGAVAYPALAQRKYDTKLTLGSLAAGGTLGILIPPSISLIVYGMLAEASVGKLFAGGVIPGILLSLIFMIYIAVRVVVNPQLAPKEEAFSFKRALSGLKDIWPIAILMLIVLGGIFGGLMTPTEAAAIGASAALILALGLRRLTWQVLRKSLATSIETTCMVLFIVLAASLFASFLGRMRAPEAFSALILDANLPAMAILLLIYLLYLFLGCFIDGISMMVLTLSTILPVVTALGFDLIWFGVILTVLIEVGMLTPPMGINLFVLQGISGRSLTEVVSGSVPFFILMIVSIALFTAFPILVLWLPNLLFGS
jgi:tripartite ATP-independent transporter DctM subunit